MWKDTKTAVLKGTATANEKAAVEREKKGQENGRTVLTLLTLQSLTLLTHSY